MNTSTDGHNEPDMYIVEEIRGRRKTRAGKFIYKIKWKFYPESQCTWEPIQNLLSVLDNIEEYDKLYMDKKNQKNVHVSSTQIKNPKEKIFQCSNQQNKPEAVLRQNKTAYGKDNAKDVEEDSEVEEGSQIVQQQKQQNNENSNLEQWQVEAENEKNLENKKVDNQQQKGGTTKCNTNLPVLLMDRKLRKYEGLIRYNNKRKLIKQQREQNQKAILQQGEQSSVKQIPKDQGPRGRWNSRRRPQLFSVKIGEIEIQNNNKSTGSKQSGSLSKLRTSDYCQYQKIVKGLLRQYKANEDVVYSHVKRKLVRKRPCLKKSLKYRGRYEQFFYTNPDKIEGIKERKNKSKDFKLVLEALQKKDSLFKSSEEHAPRSLRQRPNLETNVRQSVEANENNSQKRKKRKERSESKDEQIGKSSINQQQNVTPKKRKYVQTHERWANYLKIRQQKQKAKPIQKMRKYERQKPVSQASRGRRRKVDYLNQTKHANNNEQIVESDFQDSLKAGKAQIRKEQVSLGKPQLSHFLRFRFKQPFSSEQTNSLFGGKQSLPNLDSGSQSSSQSHETSNNSDDEEFKNPKILMKQFSSNNPVRNLMNLGGQNKFITNFQKYTNDSHLFSPFSNFGGFRKYQEEETPEEQNDTEYKQPVIKIKQMHRKIRGTSSKRSQLGLGQNLQKLIEQKLRRSNNKTERIQKQSEEVQKIKSTQSTFGKMGTQQKNGEQSKILEGRIQEKPFVITKRRRSHSKRKARQTRTEKQIIEMEVEKQKVKRPYKRRNWPEARTKPINRSYFRKSKYRLNSCDILQNISELDELVAPARILPYEEFEQLSPVSIEEQLNEFNDGRQYTMQIGPTNKLQICLKNSENKKCEFAAEELQQHYTSWIKMFYQSYI